MIQTRTGDPLLDANTVALRDEVKRLADVELLGAGKGRFIEVDLPNATAVAVRHQLKRTPKGVVQAGMSGAVSAGYVNVAKDETFITLTATGFGATITMTLWVC